ncbi:hypothetical protein VA7868_00448 [Vibrio aerogenes CECT 7868]|uniref:Uncharacterized protein n=1 Tax=Vibrio aerogenes CECT 7868 TaxID=1216006 RepID=A0A1M5VMV1_9VIBR|nr:hypothetical protein [Vibrio aerogenes]SHH76508.1 hypothetical protein VA7868_00448 [Vibrio aerogenes CECT 7868]
MYEQVEKPKENRSRAVANSVTQKKSNVKQGFGFVDNRPRSIIQKKIQEIGSISAQTNVDMGVVQRSIMSRYRWGAYFAGLPNNQARCNAIDTGEARTTIRNIANANGDITNRVITLHVWQNNAWGNIGTVTIDRSPRAATQGPLLPGAPALPGAGYDDSELTLHTAAAGGGNAGVATHLFPAVLRWINANLRGVQQLNMNPAGGAASKSVIEQLGGSVGRAHEHGVANIDRANRRNAGGPPIAGGNLNTWDTRLNAEHLHELESLDNGLAGLSLSADGMSLAGPAAPADIAAMQAQRDYFANTLTAGVDPVVNNAHPDAAYFQAAGALTNVMIAADPRAAARLLRMARLTSRSGAHGRGGAPDAGYQINMTGAALAHIMPNAVQP